MGLKEMTNTAMTFGAYSKSNEVSRLARMQAAYSPKKEMMTVRKMQSLLRKEAAKIWAYLNFLSKNEKPARLPKVSSTDGYQVSGTHTGKPKACSGRPKKTGAFKPLLPIEHGNGKEV